MIEKYFFEKAEVIIQQNKNNLNTSDIKTNILSCFANEPIHIQNRIINEFFYAGPLHPLLDNINITEIIINGPHSIYYEEKGKIIKHNDEFYNNSTFKNFIHLITKDTKSILDLSKPHLNGNWQGFRVHAISQPLTPTTCITLRRHSRNTWDFESMLKNNWAQKQEIDLILKKVHTKKNILIIGSTGSGKTTVINSMLQSLPQKERCIIIEDTDELILPNPLSTKLLTRVSRNKELLNYTQADLLKQSLRMRPQRIIVGEIRGDEAKDYLMALSTGHSGGICSLHANNAQQALIRLEMLVQVGAPNWALSSIRQLVKLSLDYIITVDIKEGHRYLKSVDKLGSLENNGFVFENMYKMKNNSVHICYKMS